MAETVEQLVRKAGAAANAGRWVEADALWADVLRLDARHPAALFSLGVSALRNGDHARALDLVRRACEAAPTDPMLHLTLARIHRERGDDAGGAEAIEAALAIDPYFTPALLAKAARYERYGAGPTAALYYRSALSSAPPQEHWPPALRGQLTHAKQVLDQHAETYFDFLCERIGPLQKDLPPSARERWTEAASIAAGRTRPYVSQANQLAVPRLPAIPFFERTQFEWAEALEARTADIRAEFENAFAGDEPSFRPYVSYKRNEPMNQWAPLNESRRWSHYGLWRGGKAEEDHLAGCPQTRDALLATDMADIEGLCPNAMFSVLAPRTEIPPHNGETNARLVCHLPLIVPEGCLYRVGFETRSWREGELLIFDDTLEHSARNDSDHTRVVLLFDIWHPMLSPEERELVRAFAAASRDYLAIGTRPAGG